MHRLVAQDVLVLLRGAGHLVLAAEREDLHEAHVEEEPFHDAAEDDEALQQRGVGLGRAGLEERIGEHVDEGDQEVVLVADALHFLVRSEDLALVQSQRFGDVLVGVRVDRLLERLAQQVLAALGRGDVAIRPEHDVVGGQRIRGHEEAEVALHDEPLVIGQPVGVFPQGDVAVHVHFLRHPVVGAAGEVLLPRPLVLERNQLVHVRLGVDDAFVLRAHAREGLDLGLTLTPALSHGRGSLLLLARSGGGRICGGADASGRGRVDRLLQAEQWGRGRVVFEAKHLSVAPLALYSRHFLWGENEN